MKQTQRWKSFIMWWIHEYVSSAGSYIISLILICSFHKVILVVNDCILSGQIVVIMCQFTQNCFSARAYNIQRQQHTSTTNTNTHSQYKSKLTTWSFKSRCKVLVSYSTGVNCSKSLLLDKQKYPFLPTVLWICGLCPPKPARYSWNTGYSKRVRRYYTFFLVYLDQWPSHSHTDSCSYAA